MVEIILLLDIYQTVKNSKLMIKSMLDKKLGDLNLGKTNSVSQMKLEHFLRSIKEECLEENEEKAVAPQDDNRRNQSSSSLRNQEKFKESFDSFQKSLIYLKNLIIYENKRVFYIDKRFGKHEEGI